MLAKHFKIIDMGELSHFSQFGMENLKSVSTPVDINTKLVKHSDDSKAVDPK